VGRSFQRTKSCTPPLPLKLSADTPRASRKMPTLFPRREHGVHGKKTAL
jgi:hypothetical protein